MVATDGETGRGMIGKKDVCNIWKKRYEPRNVGGVSIMSRNGSRNGAPSRKGCVVNGLMAKANNE